ncbi:CaiB/BaiF CoA transferase family protein [Chloroflexota bacterium]
MSARRLRERGEIVLSGFRVLDLTDEKGLLCGRMLGDLGADVIKIEKPGGDPARNIGPFYHDIPDPEKSLHWFAYNANKRGITLNIETTDGQSIFKRLVETADFVIESFSPGYMERLGLDYPSLSKLNQRIVVTSITPFGQTGPYRDYKAADIVGMAMGGLMYLTGEPDRPPLSISIPQSYLHAGGDAAVGAMIAHYHREKSGEGQHVDVSIQESLIWTTASSIPFYELHGSKLGRTGALRAGHYENAMERQLWPCKDGFVIFNLVGGVFGAKINGALTEWVDSEGLADEFIKGIDWNEFDMATVTQDTINRVEKPIGDFFLNHTKSEIYEGAMQRGIGVCPVSGMKDLMENPQLGAREFWVDITHPELGETITYPGVAVVASETPCRIRRRAPLIGEHNQEIYEKELGFTETELSTLKQDKVI